MSEPRRYGRTWVGGGIKEDLTRCVEFVSDGASFPTYYQCQFKRGHGPKKEYCRIHDPAAVKKRQDTRSEKWEKSMDLERSKWNALRDVEVLRAKLSRLEARLAAAEKVVEAAREVSHADDRRAADLGAYIVHMEIALSAFDAEAGK